MHKSLCAIGFLFFIFIFQDCVVPGAGVRVRVVKVKRQPAPVVNSHYTKRQATRGYTDVPLAGDPDPDSETFQVNTNTLRPQENPYNVGNNNRYTEPPGPGSNKPNNNNADYGNRNYKNQNQGSYIRNPYSDNNNSNNNNNPPPQQQHQQQPQQQHQQQQHHQQQFQQQNAISKSSNKFPVNNDVELISTPSSNPNTKRQNPSGSNPKPSAASQDQGSKRPPRKDGGGEDCPECGNSIPGDAGVDYPNFHTPPKTAFSCSKQSYSGYYADTEARCQVFWICQKNRADAFLCPNGTIFNQQVFVCDWWFNFDCNTAQDYYSRNQFLYAGPTVDLFGNPITPNANSNSNSNTKTKRQTTPKPPSSPASIPPPERQQILPQPNKVQKPILLSPTPRPQQLQHIATLKPSVIQNNDLITSPLVPYRDHENVRRIEHVIQPVTATTPSPPSVYNKRSQQSVIPPHGHQNKLQSSYDDRHKQQQQQQKQQHQPFGYPVPDNSLEAVEAVGEYGLKMNNYKSALDYITSDVDDLYQEPSSNPNQSQRSNQNQQRSSSKSEETLPHQRAKALQSDEIQKHRQTYETHIQRQKQQYSQQDSQIQREREREQERERHSTYSEERQRQRENQRQQSQSFETQRQRPIQQSDEIHRQRPVPQTDDRNRQRKVDNSEDNYRQPQRQNQNQNHNQNQQQQQRSKYENQKQQHHSFEQERQHASNYGSQNNNKDRYSASQRRADDDDFEDEQNDNGPRSARAYEDSYGSKSNPKSSAVYSDSVKINTNKINQRNPVVYLDPVHSNGNPHNAVVYSESNRNSNQERERSYRGNGNENQQQQQQQQQQLQRQALFSSTDVKNDNDNNFGYGRKTQRSSNRKNPFAQNNPSPRIEEEDSSPSMTSYASQIESAAQIYSTTTKRNALDYETENTTPLAASSFEEDELLSTISTPRYGEAVSKPNILYSTEIELPNQSQSQSQETTTIAPPLTFGQKLTRAAKKRNTSRWGNWRTMLLGDY